MITITFVTNNGKVTAEENSNLLRVSLRQQGGIPFKCGGGICGTCRCQIEAGLENTDKVKNKERKHLTDANSGRLPDGLPDLRHRRRQRLLGAARGAPRNCPTHRTGTAPPPDAPA